MSFREENVSPTNSKENVTPNKSCSGEKDGDKKNGTPAAEKPSLADSLPETNLDLPVPYRKTGINNIYFAAFNASLFRTHPSVMNCCYR